MAGSMIASRRFMIACAARTGSTMLVRTLHASRVAGAWRSLGATVWSADGRLADLAPADRDALEVQRFQDPAAAMARFAEAHGAEAVGLLKHDELVRPEWRQVRALVEADIDLRIVLDRRDPAPSVSLASNRVAPDRVTNVPAGGTPPAIQPFAIDIPDLLRDVAETRRRTREFAAAFARHPSIRIFHEDRRRRRSRSAIGWRRSWMSRLRQCRCMPSGSCANRRRRWC